MKNKLLFIILGIIVLLVVFITIILALLSRKSPSVKQSPVQSIINGIPFVGSSTPTVAIGKSGDVVGETRDKTLIQSEQNFQKQNHPDVYLSNMTPYESDSFNIYSDFKTEPSGHFYFLVYLNKNDVNSARNQFIAWIKKSGLTEAQIQGLDIQYFQQ